MQAKISQAAGTKNVSTVSHMEGVKERTGERREVSTHVEADVQYASHTRSRANAEVPWGLAHEIGDVAVADVDAFGLARRSYMLVLVSTAMEELGSG